MLGFEDPKPGKGSVIHNEFAGKKLRDVIDVICDSGTEKELKVCAMLEIKHKGLIVVKLMFWYSAKTFRENEKLELAALGDIEVEEVREVCCGISVYVNMKNVDCEWYRCSDV